MDIRQLTTIRNLAEAMARHRGAGEKPNPENFKAIPPELFKSSKMTPQEKAQVMQRREKEDKEFSEVRARVKQQTGIDLSAPRKIERVKMTEEEQAAYVQKTMDRIMAGDAKYQKHLQEYEKSKVDALAKVQKNIVDISA